MTSSIPDKAGSLNLAKPWMMRFHSQTDVNWSWEMPLNHHSTVRKIEKGQNGEKKKSTMPILCQTVFNYKEIHKVIMEVM